MTTQVSIDRSALALSPLVIGQFTVAAPFFLAADGVARPDWVMRRTYAPDSAFMPGKVQLGAVKDIGSLPLAVYAQADTASALESAIDEFAAACEQWAFVLTLTIDGVARNYNVYGESPQRGPVDTAMTVAHMARLSVAFPVNP